MTEGVINWMIKIKQRYGKIPMGILEDLMSSPTTCNTTEVFNPMPGNNFDEKVDFAYNIINKNTLEDIRAKLENTKPVEKRKISILIADNSESKEIVDFLNEGFEVELFDEKAQEDVPKYARKYPDLLIFTGGEDINPSMYDQSIGEFTQINKVRDRIEKDTYFKYVGCKKIGFGRGAQLLAALSGSSIVQHVTGHDKPHRITTNYLNFDIESNHHQLIYPYNLDKDRYEVIAWSKRFQSDMYLDGENEQIDLDPEFLEVEIIKFGKDTLCFQPHPETSNAEFFRNYCLGLIDKMFTEKEEVYTSKSTLGGISGGNLKFRGTAAPLPKYIYDTTASSKPYNPPTPDRIGRIK